MGSDEMLASIKDLDSVMLIVKPLESISRLKSSRRIFEAIKANDLQIPIIHHYTANTAETQEFALEVGAAVGPLLIDGIGEGVILENAVGSNLELDFLRTRASAFYKAADCATQRLSSCRARRVDAPFLTYRRSQLRYQSVPATCPVSPLPSWVAL